VGIAGGGGVGSLAVPGKSAAGARNRISIGLRRGWPAAAADLAKTIEFARDQTSFLCYYYYHYYNTYYYVCMPLTRRFRPEIFVQRTPLQNVKSRPIGLQDKLLQRSS
jgi:hypothetical protein